MKSIVRSQVAYAEAIKSAPCVEKRDFLQAIKNVRGKHYFRSRFMHMLRQRGENRIADRVLQCGKEVAITQCECGHHSVGAVGNEIRVGTNCDGSSKLATFSCMERMCPHCAPKRAAKLQGKMVALIKKLQSENCGKLFLATFTFSNVAVLPDKQKRELLDSGIRKILKDVFGAEGGVTSWECTFGKMGEMFHLHAHVIFSTKKEFSKNELLHYFRMDSKIGRKEYRENGWFPPLRFNTRNVHMMAFLIKWNRILKECGYAPAVMEAQDIREVDNTLSGVREVCKYITSGELTMEKARSGYNPQMWDFHLMHWMSAVWEWYRYRPAIRAWGIWYGYRGSVNEEILETTIAEDLLSRVCPHCKKVGAGKIIFINRDTKKGSRLEGIKVAVCMGQSPPGNVHFAWSKVFDRIRFEQGTMPRVVSVRGYTYAVSC